MLWKTDSKDNDSLRNTQESFGRSKTAKQATNKLGTHALTLPDSTLNPATLTQVTPGQFSFSWIVQSRDKELRTLSEKAKNENICDS